MKTFPGFGLSGYRTLTGGVQWIPLDDAITVFLGGNNSGKSNILRLLHTHMQAIFLSATTAQPLGSFATRVDAPRGADGEDVRVLWPLDITGVLESDRHEAVRLLLDAVLQLPELNESQYTALPFASASLAEPLVIDLSFARKLSESSPHIDWTQLSSSLTSTRGGAPGEDAQRVLFSLREWCLTPPETELVPPSRALRGADNTGGWNFSGEGMIYQLHHLKSPQFDEDDLRERANALTADLRVLLEDERLDFDVPHDLSTLNVLLGGRWFPLESLGTGTEHAVVILAARHVYPQKLLCLEEPDAHLHPRLQRRLVTLLRDGSVGQQVAIATHSAHMIDAADMVVSVHLDNGRSHITPVGDHALFEALRALGYRASDLLQTTASFGLKGPLIASTSSTGSTRPRQTF